MGTSKTDLFSNAAGILDLLGGAKSIDDYKLLKKDAFKRVTERALQAEMTQHLGALRCAVLSPWSTIINIKCCESKIKFVALNTSVCAISNIQVY